MPSMGIAQYSRAAGLARPTAPTRTAVVAASEYAGALPATAITTVSTVPRALACSPLPLTLLMPVLLSVVHDAGATRPRRRKGRGWSRPGSERGGLGRRGGERRAADTAASRRQQVTPWVRVMIAALVEL